MEERGGCELAGFYVGKDLKNEFHNWRLVKLYSFEIYKSIFI